jgi:hypothetical protein
MKLNNNRSAREIMQLLKLIHIALVITSIAFLLISLLIGSIHGALAKLDRANMQVLITLGLIAAAILVLLSYYLHSRQIKMNVKSPFILQMNQYKNSMLLKLLLMEAAALFLLVIYLLTSATSMVASSAIIIVLLLLNRPTAESISSELNLDESGVSQLME